jgi:hypothetical protein
MMLTPSTERNFKESETLFRLKPVGEGGLWSALANHTKDSTSLQIMPWRDRDIGYG